MLRYGETYKKSFLKTVKNKRVPAFAFIFVVPFFVSAIISIFLLRGFNGEVNDLLGKVIESFAANDFMSEYYKIIEKYFPEIMINAAVGVVCYVAGIVLVMPAYGAAKNVIGNKEIVIKEEYGKVFSYFKLYLLYAVKVFLWSLLLLIPGIVKAYSYSLCFSIKNDDPNKKCIECIRESQRLMKGRKERLFLQSIVFYLWVLLFSFGLGIASAIIGIVPLIGGVFAEILRALFTFYCEAVYAGILRVFYEETLKDEKIIEDNPELKEKGINGVLRTERKPFDYAAYYEAQASARRAENERKTDIFEEAEKETNNKETTENPPPEKYDGNKDE